MWMHNLLGEWIRITDNADRRMAAGQTALQQVGEAVSRYAHNVKDGGSNPPPATKYSSYG